MFSATPPTQAPNDPRHQPRTTTRPSQHGRSSFSESTYERLLDRLKVRVETYEAETGVARSSETWAAGIDGTLYLRPIHGNRADWYRDVRSTPYLAVVVDGARIPVRARRVRDAEALRNVNEALLARYGYHPVMPSLLAPSSINGTVALEPLAPGDASPYA